MAMSSLDPLFCDQVSSACLVSLIFNSFSSEALFLREKSVLSRACTASYSFFALSRSPSAGATRPATASLTALDGSANLSTSFDQNLPSPAQNWVPLLVKQ